MIIDFYNGGGGGGNTYTKQEVDAMVALLFDDAAYVSSSHTINFYHGSTVLASIDATAFIKDGMVDSVSIETISGVKYLVITFNTEAGKEDIQIPLSDIFDPDLYYTKAQIDALLSAITASIEEMDEVTARALNNLADNKQDTLTAGENITIENNVISAAGKNYLAGSGISISADTISLSDAALTTLSNAILKPSTQSYTSDANNAPEGYSRTSTTTQNLPVSYDGSYPGQWGVLMTVFENSGGRTGTQMYFCTSGDKKGTVWVRAGENNSWSAWYQMITSKELDAVSDSLTAAIQQVDRVSAQALNDLADQIGDINTILASI
jgi:hypothetical protein